MTPAEIIQRLYNAAPPADRDGDGKPDLWEKPMTLEEAEQIAVMASGGMLDQHNGRALRIDMRLLEAGTLDLRGYDEEHGQGAGVRALGGGGA